MIVLGTIQFNVMECFVPVWFACVFFLRFDLRHILFLCLGISTECHFDMDLLKSKLLRLNGVSDDFELTNQYGSTLFWLPHHCD